MSERKTISYFQWIRAVGAVAIVVLHAVVTVQGAYKAPLPLRIGEGLVVTTVARWAVPAFFMVSGALMLDPAREMGWKKALRHVWRMVYVLLTFGLAFCLIESKVDNPGAGTGALVLDALLRLATSRSWDHMWFVYTLIGLYLATPVLRPWVAGASRRELALVIGFVALTLFVSLNATAQLPYPYKAFGVVSVPSYVSYYLLGYYAHTYLELDRRIVAAGVVSLAVTLLLKYGFDQNWAVDPITGTLYPYALMVFLLFKRYADRPIPEHGVVGVLADYSFGIYLVHPAFQHLLVLAEPLAHMPRVALDVTFAAVPLVASVALVWLLRFVPTMGDKI